MFKSNFIWNGKPFCFFFDRSEVNSTWLITSELANERARKALFTCVVYTNYINDLFAWDISSCQVPVNNWDARQHDEERLVVTRFIANHLLQERNPVAEMLASIHQRKVIYQVEGNCTYLHTGRVMWKI